MTKYFSTTWRVIATIMRDWFYVKIALGSAVVLGFVNYWLLNQVTTIPEFFRMARAGDFGQYGNFYAAVYTILSLLILVLFGLSLAMLVWQWKHSKLTTLWKELSTNGLGGLASAFGAACPVCGAFLLNLLGVVGGVSAFPLKGLEFHFVSLAALGTGLVLSTKKIAPVLDGTCNTCMTSHSKLSFVSKLSFESAVIGVVIVALLANHVLLGQIGVVFGLEKSRGVGAFLSSLVAPQAAEAKSIIATKLNPDGRTTTVAAWPTITEVPAEPKGMDPVEAAKVVMLPTGKPFYAPEDISFDDPIGALNNWQRYEREIQLSSDLDGRYKKIISTMTCDYCCGGPTRVTAIGNCGCSHSAAYRSIAKYLLKNYGDKYSDDEIIGELQRWKGMWYPKGVVEDYLLATGRGDILGHETHGGAGADGKHGF